MAKITLLLDEDVRVLLAEILRQRGYDVVHVLELDVEGRAILSSSCMPSAKSASY